MSALFSQNYISPYVSPVVSPVMSPIVNHIVNSAVVSPVSQINVTPYSTQITTANIFTPLAYNLSLDVDTGLNSSYIAQKDITEYLWYRVLDKWLYEEELCYLLKYLKIKNNVVSPISSENDYKDNKICDDSVEDIEKKTDYIQEHILTKKNMKKLLQRILNELNYKWYELTNKEHLVVEVVERYLKTQLKERVGTK